MGSEATTCIAVSECQEICVKDVLTLVKIRITAPIAVTTAGGYLLAGGNLDQTLFLASLGALSLGCGAAALNEVQERRIDGAMPRTCRRPLPGGRMTLLQAGVFVVLFLSAGIFLLSQLTVPLPLLIGILNLIWYNGVYTYLKRLTAFAAVPGALTGALPPLIGCAAAGASVLSPSALVFPAFIFLWQLPHFWILLLTRGAEYAAAGLPSLPVRFSSSVVRRLTFASLIAAVASGFLFPLTGLLTSASFIVCYAALSVWLLARAGRALLDEHERCERAFYQLIIFGVAVFVLVLVEAAR